MRIIFSLIVLIAFFSACDVPKEIQTSPSNSTNTSGTLGSAPATDKPAAAIPVPDTSRVKRDSL